MFRKLVPVFLVLCALALVVGCDSGSDAEIAALSERVATLEKQIETLAKAGAGGGAVLEAEARTNLAAVQAMISSGKIDDARTKMKSYGVKYASTKVGRSFQRLNQELAVFGKNAPSDWAVEKWFQGESEINLASNEPTVVVFWETWCPHCQREVPKLQAFYDSLKGDGLQIVGLTKVTKSSTEQKVEDFIKQKNLSYPIAKENGSASQHFGVAGIPAAAVVKDGKIIWRGHPSRLSEEQLRSWL